MKPWKPTENNNNFNSLTSKLILLFTILILSATGSFAQSYLIPVDAPNNRYPITFTDIDQRTLILEFDRTVTAPGTSTGWTITVGGVPVVMAGNPSAVGNFLRITLPSSITYANRNSVMVSYNGTGGLTLTGGLNPIISNVQAVNNYIAVASDFTNGLYGELPPRDICARVEDVDVEFQLTLSKRYRNSIHYAHPRIWVQWEFPNGDPRSVGTYFTEVGGAGSGSYQVVQSYNGYPDNTINCTWDISMYPYLWNTGTLQPNLQVTQNRVIITIPNYKRDNGTPVPGTGDLGLDPPVDDIRTLFCVGDDIVAFTFTDATVFDCQVDVSPSLPNINPRYVQFVYGTHAGNGIPNVFINVFGTMVRVTDANGNVILGPFTVDAFGNAVAPYMTTQGFEGPVVQYLWDAGTASLITPRASTYPIYHTGDFINDEAGDIFDVTLRNWGPCNPYDAGNPFTYLDAVSEFSRLRLVESPPPPTVEDKTICYGDNRTLNVTSPVMGEIRWYRDAALTNLAGTGTSYTQPQTAPGIYTYWVVDRFLTGLQCQSPPTEVTLTIREELSRPGIISGPSSTCPNVTGLVYSVAANPPTMPFGGPTEYYWYTTNAGITIASGQGTRQVTVNVGSISGSWYIRVRNRYTTTPTCQSNYRNFTLTVYSTTHNPGSIGGSNICAGGTVNITNTASATTGTPASSGPVYSWHRATGPGFGTWTALPGTGATYSEVMAAPGVYRYRRTATFGCGDPVSTTRDITVYSTANNGGNIGGSNICAGETVNITNITGASTGAPASSGPTYSWHRSVAPYTVWTPLAGTGATFSEVMSTPGTYRYRRTATFGCGTPATATRDITVNPLPEPVISGETSPCVGDTRVYEIPSIAGRTYTWDVSPNGSISGSPNNVTVTVIWNASGPGWVRVTERISITSCQYTTPNYVVNVNPAAPGAAGAISGLANVCYGQSGVVYSIAPITNASNYVWSMPAGVTIASGQGTTSVTLDFAPGAASPATISVYAENGCGQGAASNRNITIYNQLNGGTIGSNQTICYGADVAEFTSTAPATGGAGSFTYTWQYTTNLAAVPGGAGWTNIPGSNSLTWDYGTLTTSTKFVRRAVEGTCAPAVYSNEVTVTVRPELNGGTIGSNQTICYGDDVAAFTSSAPATGGAGSFTYTWQYTTNMSAVPGGAGWNDIPASNSLTWDYGTLTTTTKFVRRAVEGTCSTPVYSNQVTVTVHPELNGGAIGSNQTICYGADVAAFTNTTSASGGAGSFTYTWQYTTNMAAVPGGAGWTNIPSSNTPAYDYGTLTTTTKFVRRAVEGTCTTPVYSNEVTVTVRPELNGGTVGTDQTICYGDDVAAFTSSASATGGAGVFTYTWQYTTNMAAVPGGAGWTNIPASNSLTWDYGTLTTTTKFVRRAVDGTCTTPVYSNQITVTVRPQLNGGTIGSDQTICYGADVAAFTSSAPATGGAGAFTYTWQYTTNMAAVPGGAGWSDVPASNTPAIDYGTLTTTTKFVRRAVEGTCTTPVYSNQVTVTVRPELNGGTIGSDQTICYGADVAPFISSAPATGGAGVFTYTWQYTTNMAAVLGGAGWTNIPASNSLTYDYGTLTTTTKFVRRAVEGTCTTPVYSNEITVTVRPVLNGGTIGSDQTICYGDDVPAFTSSAAATGGAGVFTYTWQYTTNMAAVPGDGNWIDIPSSNNPVYDYGVLTSPTKFVRRAVEGTCSTPVYSNMIIITVLPELQGGAIGTTQSICYGDDVPPFSNLAPATGGTGTYTYTWQYTTNMSALPGDAGWSDIAGSDSPAYDYGTLTDQTMFVRKVEDLSCVSSAYSNVITISVNPLPVTSVISGPDLLCDDATNVVYQVVNTPGSTYSWTVPPSLTITSPPGLYFIIVDAVPGMAAPGDMITVTETFTTTTGCVGVPVQKPVTVVSTLPGVVVAGPTEVCQGDTDVIYSVPDNPGSTYSWLVPAGAAITSDPTLHEIAVTFNMALTGQVSVVESSNGVCTTVHVPISVTVNPLPSVYILTAPMAYCTGVPGVTITLSGSQVGVNYQLFNTPGPDGPALPGTGSALTWADRETETYYVVATNATTGCTRQMNGIVTPVINFINAGSIGNDQAVCETGAPVPFVSITDATGGGSVTYQWQSSADNITYNNITGATSAVYTAGTLAQDTWFRRVAVSTMGTTVCSDESNEVLVTVINFLPGSISADQTICEGEIPVPFSFVAPSGDGVFTYQWKSSPDGVIFTDIPGAENETYAPGALTADTWFKREVRATLMGVPCVRETNAVRVTVINFSPGFIEADQTICEGTAPAAFTGTAATGDGTKSYRWLSSTDNVIFAPIAGATSATYTSPALTQDTWFKREATAALNGVTCTQETNTLLVTVNNFDQGSISADQDICEGDTPAPFTSVTPTGDGVFTYQWQSSTDGVSFNGIPGATLETYAPGALIVDTWFRRQVTSTLNSMTCTEYTNVVRVTVNNFNPGSISGSQTICEGDTPAPFTAAVPSGDGTHTFQWQDSPDGVTFTDIPGATSPTYSAGALVQDTWYRRVVTSTLGTSICSAETNIIRVTVNNFDPGSIGSDQTICENTAPMPLTSISPTGDGIFTYRWFRSIDGVNFAIIPAAVGETYSPGILTADTWYRREVTSTLGTNTCVEETNTVLITVNNFVPGSITADQTICEGEIPVPFGSTAPAGDGIFTYQWKESGDGIVFTDIGGATNETYAPGALMADTWYKRAVTSTVGTNACTEETNIVRVTVINFTPGTIGTDQTICEGTAPASFTGTTPAGDGTFTYTWEFSTDNINWSPVAGATSATYSAPPLTVDTWYRRIVTATLNGYSCSQETPSILITVINFDPGSISADQDICEGDTPAPLTSVAPSGDGVFTYQWQSSLNGVNFSNITGATDETYASGALIADTWYRRQVTSTLNLTSCSQATAPVRITVNNFIPGSIGSSQTICENDTPLPFTSVNATGDGTITYQWQDSPDGITFTDIPGAVAATFTPGQLTQDTWYTRVVTSTLGTSICSAGTNIIKVTVNNFVPGSIGSDQTICEGTAPATLTSVTPTGDGIFTYKWFSSPDGTTFTEILGAISEVFNPGNLIADTWYRREVTSTLSGRSCSDVTNIVRITVINFDPGSITGDQTICEGEVPAVPGSVAASGDGTIEYQWRSSNDGVNYLDIPGATSEVYAPGALTQDTWYMRSVTSTLNGITCTRLTNSIRITVNNVNAGTIIADQTICNGADPVAFMSVVHGTGDGAVTYQWQTSDDGTNFTDIPGANALNYDSPPLMQDAWFLRITRSLLNGIECTKISNIVRVTVNEVYGGTISADQTICFGDTPVPFASVDDGSGSGVVTYQWLRSDNDVIYSTIPGATSTGYTPGIHYTDTYYKRILTSILNGIICTVESNVIKITVNPLPVAVLTGGETICPGESSILTVTLPAGVGPFELDIENHGVVSGYNSGEDIIVSPLLTTTYRLLRVTDVNNCEVVSPSSNLMGTATVTVRDLPAIVTSPADKITCEYGVVSFNVVATGMGITYQWYADRNDGNGFTAITDGGIWFGSQTATLNLFGVTRDMDGYLFNVEVSTCGDTVTSDDALLTVNTVPEIQMHPKDTTICLGGNAEFTVAATGSGITYLWQVNTGTGFNDVIDGANITGQGTPAINITNAPAGFNNNIFRVIVSGVCGAPVYSNFAILRVNLPPAVSMNPANASVCDGSGPVYFIANGSGLIDSIRWQVSTNGGTTWDDIYDGAIYSGTTSQQLALVNVPLSYNTNQYRLGLKAFCATTYTNGATLTVHSLPVINFPSDTINACGGVAQVIDPAPSGGSGVWTQHIWTGDVGPLNNYFIQAPTFRSYIPGPYSLNYRVRDNNGCFGTGDVVVMVDSPDAAFTQDISFMCTPGTVTFTKDMTGIASWTWDFDDGTTNTVDENPVHVFTNSSPSSIEYYNVRLTVESPGGCTASQTTLITIYPAIDATFNADKLIICSGEAIMFNALPGANSYFWDYGDGISGPGVNVTSHLYTNMTTDPIVHTVTLTTTSFYNCTDVKTLDITVMPVPVPQFTAAPTPQLYNPAGNTVNFTNETNPGTWTYTWDFGDGGSSTDVNPSYTYTGGLGTYNVTLTATNGTCTRSIMHQISILPEPPVADFDSIPSGCAPLYVQINNTTVNADLPGTTFRWDFGDGSYSTAKNPTYTYFTPGIYRIELTVTGPGGTSITSQVVHAYPSPKAYFEIAPTLVFVNDERVRCFNLSQGADSYLWEFGDGDTSKLEEPYHRYMEEGVYDITLWAYSDNGCSDVYVLSPGVTVEPVGELRFATVFTPNKEGPIERTDLPMSGIEADQFFYPPIRQRVLEYKLQIFNRLGVLIYETRDINKPWNGYYKGQLCPQGVYVWYVEGKFANGEPYRQVGDVTLLH